jgi:ABC-type sugar transport system ATPase subunit
MLDVSQIAKTYPTPRGPLSILAGVSFNLQRGDAAAIMGPSGAGKSTLLYILGGLEQPTSGTVTLDGRNPYRAIREGSGRVPQPGDRLHLSRSLPAAAVFRAGKRARADAGFGLRSPRLRRSRARSVDASRPEPIASITAPPSFPAARNSA